MKNYRMARSYLESHGFKTDHLANEQLEVLANGILSALKEDDGLPVDRRSWVHVYTDGSCLNNPGVGGYAAVMMLGNHRRELSDGVADTTNNRMELMGVIAALEALKKRLPVVVYSDSEYVVKNFARVPGWKAKGWVTSSKKPVENVDLWERLCKAIDEHTSDFAFEKVVAHVGILENERCDMLAKIAAKRIADELAKAVAEVA